MRCRITDYRGFNLRAFTFVKFVQNLYILTEEQNMKLLETVSGESHMRICGRTDVTKLIVASRLAFAVSRRMDSTEGNNVIFSYFTWSTKMKFQFRCPLTVFLKTCLPNSFTGTDCCRIRILSIVFIGVHCLYTFVDIVLI